MSTNVRYRTVATGGGEVEGTWNDSIVDVVLVGETAEGRREVAALALILLFVDAVVEVF